MKSEIYGTYLFIYLTNLPNTLSPLGCVDERVLQAQMMNEPSIYR